MSDPEALGRYDVKQDKKNINTNTLVNKSIKALLRANIQTAKILHPISWTYCSRPCSRSSVFCRLPLNGRYADYQYIKTSSLKRDDLPTT